MLNYSQKYNISDTIVRKIEKIIKVGKTPFQEYTFFESETNGVCISINGDIQSCEVDENLYHEALVHPAMLMHKKPENVLIMGGGEGATAREVLKHGSVLNKVIMVDIDKEFVDVCKEIIPSWSKNIFDNNKLEVQYKDINSFLQETNIKFDVVIGDLVDVDNWDSLLANLYSNDFYTNLKKVLNNDAIISTQAGSLSISKNINHINIRKNLRNVFSHIKSYGLVIPSFYGLWGYILASDKDTEINYRFYNEIILKRILERNINLDSIGNENFLGLFMIPKAIKQTYEQY